jgi:hypothetical protein
MGSTLSSTQERCRRQHQQKNSVSWNLLARGKHRKSLAGGGCHDGPAAHNFIACANDHWQSESSQIRN